MRLYPTVAIVGSLLCLPASAQRPTPAEQKRTIDTAREIAIHYSGKLPDFICTEQVERTSSTAPNNKKGDRLTIELTYSGKESYKLTAMNGRSTTQTLESLDGLITGGEFGSLLLGIFDPSSSADFRWKESSNIRKHSATVYTYRIARANSHYLLGHRAQDGTMLSAPAGYHGEVVLDNQTTKVLRLTATADDIPKGSDILQSSMTVDYDFIEVSGTSHLLPSHSEASMERGYRQITNSVTFVDYRKFGVSVNEEFYARHLATVPLLF